MNYWLESEVWMTAQRVMPEQCFRNALVNAVTTYKRAPGHARLERLHVADIGVGGIHALRIGLALNSLLQANDPPVYLSLRAPLRGHLFAELQWNLIAASKASEVMIDGYFARDLGL